MSAATVRPISRYSTVNWLTAIVMVIFHLLAVTALFYFSWTLLAASVALYWVAVGFGISLGYHRLHTHRSYQVPKWLDYFFAICGTLTLEGGPIFWVATHRIHHQHSDTDRDPHNARGGRRDHRAGRSRDAPRAPPEGRPRTPCGRGRR